MKSAADSKGLHGVTIHKNQHPNSVRHDNLKSLTTVQDEN